MILDCNLAFDSIFEYGCKLSYGCNDLKLLVYQFFLNIESAWLQRFLNIFYGNANFVLFTTLKILEKIGYSFPVFW